MNTVTIVNIIVQYVDANVLKVFIIKTGYILNCIIHTIIFKEGYV